MIADQFEPDKELEFLVKHFSGNFSEHQVKKPLKWMVTAVAAILKLNVKFPKTAMLLFTHVLSTSVTYEMFDREIVQVIKRKIIEPPQSVEMLQNNLQFSDAAIALEYLKQIIDTKRPLLTQTFAAQLIAMSFEERDKFFDMLRQATESTITKAIEHLK